MDKSISISIITPVYNREDCIARCIESVVKQSISDCDIEHIIVDDGSSDNTKDIIMKYAKEYQHINPIFFEKNLGTNAARNAAIKAANGKFCLILDSDDYLVDDAVNIICEAVAQYPDFLHYLFVPSDRESEFANSELFCSDKVFTYEDFLSGRVVGDFIHLVSTGIMQKYPFEEKIRIYEFISFLKFYKEEKNAQYICKVVTIRERSRADSVLRTVIWNNKKTIATSCEATKIILSNFETDLKKCNYISALKERYDYLLKGMLALSDYDSFDKWKNKYAEQGGVLPFYLSLIYKLRLGWFYYCSITLFFKLKYDVLKMHTK